MQKKEEYLNSLDREMHFYIIQASSLKTCSIFTIVLYCEANVITFHSPIFKITFFYRYKNPCYHIYSCLYLSFYFSFSLSLLQNRVPSFHQGLSFIFSFPDSRVSQSILLKSSFSLQTHVSTQRVGIRKTRRGR